MAAKRPYQVPNKAGYERLFDRLKERLPIHRAAYESGTGAHHFNLAPWFERHLQLAGLSLAFEHDDAEVRGHFENALAIARLWFESGQPWQPRPQPVDPKITVTNKNGRSYEQIEAPPRMAEIGWVQDWDIGYFTAALSTFLAFGNAADVMRASELPEVAYRNPNIVADPVVFGIARANKAWALGRFDDLRRACADVLECPPPTGMPAKWSRSMVKSREPQRVHARALLALADNNAGAFSSALAELTDAHKQRYATIRDSGSRFYSLSGLSLARMAKSHGLETPDTPTIPARLLPGPLR